MVTRYHDQEINYRNTIGQLLRRTLVLHNMGQQSVGLMALPVVWHNIPAYVAGSCQTAAGNLCDS
jgi:hypothetical protein